MRKLIVGLLMLLNVTLFASDCSSSSECENLYYETNDEKYQELSNKFYVEECLSKTNIYSCMMAAETVEMDYTEEAILKQYKFYKIGCDNNDPSSCSLGGMMFIKNGEKHRDLVDKGLMLLKEGCQMGDHLSCFELGKLFKEGSFLPKMEYKANKLLYVACDYGNGEKKACEALNYHPKARLLFKEGEKLSVINNEEEAKVVFKEACELGDGESCLAYALRLPKEKNIDKIEYIEKSCNQYSILGCELAVKLYDNLKTQIKFKEFSDKVKELKLDF